MINRLLALAILCTTWTAAAALQYERLNPNLGAGLLLHDHARITLAFLRADGSPADFSATFPGGLNHFGYYILDSAGQITTTAPLDLASLDNGQLQLGNFTAGDRIAFWASGDNGVFIDSIHRQQMGTERKAAYVGDNGQPPLLITMGNITRPGWNPEKNLAEINDQTNFIFSVISDPAQPPDPGHPASGQPLPGALVALICGLGATGTLMLLRKHKK